MRYFLVYDYSIYKLGFVEASSVFLHHLYHVYVRSDFAVVFVHDLFYRVDRKLGEFGLRSEDAFRVQGGACDLFQPFLVVGFDANCNLV